MIPDGGYLSSSSFSTFSSSSPTLSSSSFSGSFYSKFIFGNGAEMNNVLNKAVTRQSLKRFMLTDRLTNQRKDRPTD